MSQIVDRVERSHNYKRDYRKKVSSEEMQASFVFIPQYMKYVLPAINITLIVLGAVLAGILFFV